MEAYCHSAGLWAPEQVGKAHIPAPGGSPRGLAEISGSLNRLRCNCQPQRVQPAFRIKWYGLTVLWKSNPFLPIYWLQCHSLPCAITSADSPCEKFPWLTGSDSSPIRVLVVGPSHFRPSELELFLTSLQVVPTLTEKHPCTSVLGACRDRLLIHLFPPLLHLPGLGFDMC